MTYLQSILSPTHALSPKRKIVRGGVPSRRRLRAMRDETHAWIDGNIYATSDITSTSVGDD